MADGNAKSAYQRAQEARCQWCWKGLRIWPANNQHFEGERLVGECTAPTIEEFCEEQARWLNSYEKRIAALEQDKARLVESMSAAIKLPRPWLDGGITWDDWDRAWLRVEEAIDATRSEHGK